MKKSTIGVGTTFIFALALVCQSVAQEVSFTDYMQPPKDLKVSHMSRDSNVSAYDQGNAAYSISCDFEAPGMFGNSQRIWNWPANGDPENNGSKGMGVGLTGTYAKIIDAFNVTFYYKPETGAVKKFRMELNNGLSWDWGSSAIGGLVNLNGKVGEWNRYRTRRINTASDPYGNSIRPLSLRLMAIQDSNNVYPTFGTYNAAAGLSFDNFRVTVPRRLNGLYKVTGTTNKNVGTVTFNNTGGLLQYNDWVQNLGNVELVNIFGFPNFGNATTTSQNSNLVYTYIDGSSVRQFGRDRFNPDLNSVASNSWMGTGVTGSAATDKFFAYTGLKNGPTSHLVLRQVTTSVYSHYFRTLNDNSGYAAEVPINLGGEAIVAIADVNNDGFDDVVTRSGSLLKVRHWTNESGVWPNRCPVFGTAATLSNYGYLKCLAVTDFNDDGADDLVMNDPVSGDVFSLVSTPSGTSTLKWLFQLNNSLKEKIYAVTDADDDGFPDIYTTRQRSGDSVGEINIRKPNNAGTSILSVGIVAEFNYDAYKPCAIGDINGDGAADIVMIKNDAPYYSVISFLVNPINRALLIPPTWICNAGTPTVRPIFQYGSN